jgi:hypothetical protein
MSQRSERIGELSERDERIGKLRALASHDGTECTERPA